MSEPGEQIGAGLAGCGCVGVLVVFVGALVGGAGLGGSVVVALVVLFVVAYMVSLVS
ncbi:hypothetical protein GCM10027270_14840 [Nocardioides ginkgobilobae]